MCGIAGIAAFAGGAAPGTGQLEAMCATLVHRGPDDQGIAINGPVGLAMRRLSIIDVAGGHQPICNEDGSVLTVLNGEIYNFRELRRELEARGHRFATQSDTEVIVHAYEEYGADCVRRLNGMFAFALHDTRRRKLLLARDHIGIKPFYYAFRPPYLIWGSEIKAVLASGLVGRTLDLDALAQFLAWEYVPGRGSLLREVRKLEPGHLIEIDLDDPRCEPRAFWDVPEGGEDSSARAEDWIEAVDAKLRECAQRQLVSDVPVGAFLSGGVDSSLLVSAIGQTETFSIGFDDPSYSELPWARRVAEHLGVEHRDEIVRPSVVELFRHLMTFLDDPIGDFSIFPTYLVSRLAREHVTVVLSGDGGDELFGGYETYLADRWARYYGRLPGPLRAGLIEPLAAAIRPRSVKKGLVNKGKRFIEGAARSPALSHARWRLFQVDGVPHPLFTPEAAAAVETPVEQHIVELFSRAGTRQPLNRSLYVDLKSYLCDNILVKVDRMSMAVSLEARVPYLDPELVELAFRIPERHKVGLTRTKVLLKQVAARHVPRECVYRPKEGFSIPIKNWLGSEFRPLLEDLLGADRLRAEGLFEPACVERMKAEHLDGRANHSHVLWSLMVFQAWRDMWLDGR
jgi:asparagine synthase (glutamine-hydrolysing)